MLSNHWGWLVIAGFVTWPIWVIVALCFVFGALPPLFIGWLIYRSPIKAFFQRAIQVESALIGSVAILFGLFAAFLANDIWSRNLTAQNAVVHEADAIRTLARYTEGMAAEHNEVMRKALTDYIQTVIEKDWPKMAEGSRSTELLAKVRQISTLIIAGEIGRAAGPTIQGRMIDAFTAIRENRQTRVQLAENRKLTIKWYSLLVFGLLTQVSIAIVHVNRPRPVVFAQAIFGIAFSACVAILIINEFPFSPLNPISPEPLKTAMESLTRK